MASTSTVDHIIFLGPPLAALNKSKPLHAKPILRSSTKSHSITEEPPNTLHSKKRHRPVQKASLRDETELNLPQSKRIRATQDDEVNEEQTVVSYHTGDSLNTRSRRTVSQYGSDSIDESQQSRHTPLETSDAEPEYSTDDEDIDDSLLMQRDVALNRGESGPVMYPISKAERLRLGPARIVGMTRTAVNKAPLLKAMERPRLSPERVQKKQIVVRPGPRPLSEIDNQTVEESSFGGATTVESIPPPPTHAFSLSHLTSISTLISSPNRFLSAYQGGSQHEGAIQFNLLALVVRVGGLEDAPDWKTGGRRRMDRCEIVIRDASDCALKVVLERDCATNWATPREQDSMDADQVSSIESLAEESQTSSDVYWNSLDASNLAAQDDSNSASRTTIERQKDDRLLPLRPGDVVVLSRLYLVRPRPSKGRSSSRFNDIKALSTHAIASPSSGATLELCWRSSVQRPIDQRRNFDKCLTTFDARCRAIFSLAQSWRSSE